MKPSRMLFTILLSVGSVAVPFHNGLAQSDDDLINAARSVIKADRQAVVADSMQLTETEAQKFWPLYHQYRAEMDTVGDSLMNLVKEYANYYPNVPEDSAKKMLKDLAKLEKKQLNTRAAYLKKLGKILPAAKTLRFAQVENRLDLAVRLKLAAAIPLVPIEGQLPAATSGSIAFEPGVPGGTLVRTVEMTATVAAIDRGARNVTLVSSDGIKKTVKAGPEVINLDQIRVGDHVKLTATQELVVQMAQPGESAETGSNALVALAARGARPGGLMAETRQVTARVTAINPENRTATLQFEDGSTMTFPVRDDVDLNQRKVGEQVVFRVTNMIAVGIEEQ